MTVGFEITPVVYNQLQLFEMSFFCWDVWRAWILISRKGLEIYGFVNMKTRIKPFYLCLDMKEAAKS